MRYVLWIMSLGLFAYLIYLASLIAFGVETL
jgi:hypothetical protein